MRWHAGATFENLKRQSSHASAYTSCVVYDSFDRCGFQSHGPTSNPVVPHRDAVRHGRPCRYLPDGETLHCIGNREYEASEYSRLHAATCKTSCHSLIKTCETAQRSMHPDRWHYRVTFPTGSHGGNQRRLIRQIALLSDGKHVIHVLPILQKCLR